MESPFSLTRSYTVLNNDSFGVIRLSDSRLLIGVVSSIAPRNHVVHHETYFRPVPYYCMLADHAQTHGATLMLFTPNDVNWRQRTVEAFVPKSQTRPFGNWHRCTMSLPHVIYENVFVHLAIQGYAVQLRNMARKFEIPVFNPPLPGKWLMAKWLMNSVHSSYQPETMLLPKPSVSRAYIDKWGTAYVKPVGGYGGMNVARIELLFRGQYRLSIDRVGRHTEKIRIHMNEQKLNEWLGKRNRPYLLQRGLNLIEVNGRKIDFRAVVNRDAKGKWNMVGIIPKLAVKDGVVTNIIAGGELYSLNQLMDIAKRQGTAIPVDKITTCALDVAKLISARASYTGLAGFDVGVEENNRVSIIEMNPKPARSLLSKEMRAYSAKCLSGFAIYLAEHHS